MLNQLFRLLFELMGDRPTLSENGSQEHPGKKGGGSMTLSRAQRKPGLIKSGWPVVYHGKVAPCHHQVVGAEVFTYKKQKGDK